MRVVVLLLLLSAACAPPSTTDGGALDDAGARLDGGVLQDGGEPNDGGAALDGGAPLDGGATSDGGVPNDDDAGPKPPCDPSSEIVLPDDAGCAPTCGTLGGEICAEDIAACDGRAVLAAADCVACCGAILDAGTIAVDAGVAPDAGPAVATCAAAAPFVAPDGCPFTNEIVVYGQEAWNVLGDALAADLSACSTAFISIPPQTADKTTLRAGEAARMHDRGPRMHALAEFHYTGWNEYRQTNGLTWRDVGRLFRARMVDAGYCVESGDTWAINELPSAVRRDPTLRPGFQELVAGLVEGEDGMPTAKGVVFVVGLGHATTNFAVYKPIMEEWSADTTFWTAMNAGVRFWGQEVYVDPTLTCVTTATRDERAAHVNAYVMHPARLAAAAPDAANANTAQSFFSRTYVPVMNAVFAADPSRGYGDTTITLEQMRRHIGQQVYAVRSWADTHTTPDGRIGFAFASYATPDPWATMAADLATALAGAYADDGAGAAGACVDGACDCGVAGSAFNEGWSTFATW